MHAQTMEAEERPNKLRKLNHDHAAVPGDTIAPGKQSVEEGQQPPIIPSEPNNLIDKQKQEDDDEQDPSSAPPLSNNQLKKLRKQQQWEENRDARKLRRKEKQSAKKARKREAAAATAVVVDENNGAGTVVEHTSPPPLEETGDGDDDVDGQQQQQRPVAIAAHKRVKKPTQLPLALIIDCSFDDLMTDKEKVSLSSQLTRCYSDNRNAAHRAHLIISSFGGGLKQRFETVLANHHRGWKGVRFTEDDFLGAAQEVQKRMRESHGEMNDDQKAIVAVGGGSGALQINSVEGGEIIYLTSDSPDTLTELRAYNTYIIGGLVDRNRHKGICYKRAKDRGVKTAKLPIGDYLKMASRFVLTTNQVVEIMLNWLECGDWAEAFLKVVPKRKGGVLKTKIEEKKENGGEAEDRGDDEEEALQGNHKSGHDGDSNETDKAEGGAKEDKIKLEQS